MSFESIHPCWDLLSFKLMSESRYLFRAFDFLKAAADRNFILCFDVKELQSAVDGVKGDLNEAKNVLKETIDMVSLYKLLPEYIDLQLCLDQRVRLRRLSGYNMEYLSILAAIFLPM